MKVIIYYDGRYEDNFQVKADTLEELREIALQEADKRGWEYAYCWSEVFEE